MNNSKQNLSLEELSKVCVVEDLEGNSKSLQDIDENTYVAVVAVDKESDAVLVFIENVEAEDREGYSVKDFISNVMENCDEINPTRIKRFIEINNELKHSNLQKLLAQPDGSVWACIDGYVEHDSHWNADNKNAGPHSLIVSAKKGDVSLDWVAKQRVEILKSLKNGEESIASEVQEAKEFAKNPSAYYGVSDSDLSSLKPSTKKRF